MLLDPAGSSEAPRGVDVEAASEGRFSADPQAVYQRWAEFRGWAAEAPLEAAQPISQDSLRAVVPRPAQVFAIGLNYRDHAAESGFELPTEPVVFTKYVSSFTGPTGDITLSPGNVDWEVELVAVIADRAHHAAESQGWSHIAGVTVGQDISDRSTQFAAAPPQFGMGKSYPGYSPLGPTLVTPDEFVDRDSIALGCEVNDISVQKGSTADLVFTVPQLVAKLSAITPLLPGDVIFTGTPAGVGQGRDPQQFLADGDVLTSWIERVGTMRHRFVAHAGT
ncbi:fumarylacetoacetate hydrolase family protein [Actinomycetospora flava]|uniref:Fumarylacetoacetate hydrolase family protein n=1 Tax=Actinomycetospora flava TaxID=3129232 RepID=A0ABU8M5W7_9PSEU